MYSMKDLSSKVNRTPQSIYALLKNNKDFVSQHSTKQGRFVKYDEALLNWLLDYYGEEPTLEATEAPQSTDNSKPEEIHAKKNNASNGLTEALNEIDRKNNEIAYLKNEIDYLRNQNNQLLLLL